MWNEPGKLLDASPSERRIASTAFLTESTRLHSAGAPRVSHKVHLQPLYVKAVNGSRGPVQRAKTRVKQSYAC